MGDNRHLSLVNLFAWFGTNEGRMYIGSSLNNGLP